MTPLVIIALSLFLYLWLTIAEHRVTHRRRPPLIMEAEDRPANLIGLACLAVAGMACVFCAIRLTVYFVTGA